MSTDWLVIAAGLVAILVILAPLYLAPFAERWNRDDRHYTGTWDEEAG